jgi:hypothetical protein
MPNVFFAGRELVRWDLTAVGANGPYRLTMQHAGGSIVEYFSSATAALIREQELEELLIAARGVSRPAHTARCKPIQEGDEQCQLACSSSTMTRA